jgi:hypothetical protein
VSGTAVAGEGNHVLVASATDRAGHTTTVTVRFTLQAAASDLVVSAPAAARVLLALETADAPFLRATLRAAGVSYTAVFGREAWLRALRTGLYNVVVVYRPLPSENGTAWPELRENVAAGVGLILIKDHPDAMPKLGPALGAAFAGKRKGATSVTLRGPLGPLTVPMSGDSVRQVVTSGGAGTSSKGDVVAALGGLGAGASVTLSWDTERATGPSARDLYLKAVAYVTPPEPLVVAGGVLPLRARLDALRAGTYRLDLLLPDGVTFLDATPPTDAPGLLRWTVSLVASAVFQVDAWLRLPERSGTYPVVVEESRDSVRVGSSTQTYAVDASPEELAALLIARLEALPLVGVDDAARDQAVAELGVISGLPISAAEAAIPNLLTAAERVASIGTADTTLIRMDLGRLLRIWQARSTL